MEYAFRKSALVNETSYSIANEQLIIKDLKTGSERKLDFQSISNIELKYLAKRSMPDAYLCIIKENGGKTHTISSQHYAGVASFESRASTYSAFVLELHNALANYPIRFSKGTNSFVYWLSMVFFMGAGLVALIIAIVAFIPYGIFIIAVLVFLFFRLKKHFTKNKPGSYDPKNIPKELLP